MGARTSSGGGVPAPGIKGLSINQTQEETERDFKYQKFALKDLTLPNFVRQKRRQNAERISYASSSVYIKSVASLEISGLTNETVGWDLVNLIPQSRSGFPQVVSLLQPEPYPRTVATELAKPYGHLRRDRMRLCHNAL